MVIGYWCVLYYLLYMHTYIYMYMSCTHLRMHIGVQYWEYSMHTLLLFRSFFFSLRRPFSEEDPTFVVYFLLMCMHTSVMLYVLYLHEASHVLYGLEYYNI